MYNITDIAQTKIVSPMLPKPFRVQERREEIPGCVSLTVESIDHDTNTGFEPGQFYMMYVFGQGEVPISVSGDASRSNVLTFTVMSVGSVTRAICAVTVGDMIGLRGPYGSAWPLEKIKGRDVIVMAGGLGLAPLRPALYHLLKHHNEYGELNLLYGTRQPTSVLFQSEMHDWKRQAPIDIGVTVDTAGREWPGKIGVVTELLRARNINPNKTSVLICGPEIMMRFSAYRLMDLGVAAKNIFVSMERNMKCAVKMCGRCQYGPYFICHDGPVFSFDRIKHLFAIREV